MSKSSNRTARGDRRQKYFREVHALGDTDSRYAAALSVLAGGVCYRPAAPTTNPVRLEMTLDVARQPGSKRLPTVEIGDAGEATSTLVQGRQGPVFGGGQYRVFVAGPLEDRFLSAGARAGDDELVAALSEAADLEAAGRFSLVRRRRRTPAASGSIPISA